MTDFISCRMQWPLPSASDYGRISIHGGEALPAAGVRYGTSISITPEEAERWLQHPHLSESAKRHVSLICDYGIYTIDEPNEIRMLPGRKP